MADIALQAITDEDGGAVTFTAATAGGDTFTYQEDSFVLVRNDDAAPHTITFTPVETVINDARRGELARDAIALTVAAGAVGLVPALPTPFRDPATGKVSVTYDAVTSLSVAVVRTS